MPYLIGLSTSCKGRIYQAAQIAEANGNKVANLILAVEKGQDSDGNKLSDFIDCAFWGRDAELIARYPEGHEINIICGKMNATAYIDKTDKPRVRYKLTVYVWQSLQSLSKNEHEAQTASSSSGTKTQPNEEELAKQALSFKFSKGQYANKTVQEILDVDCRYIYDLCNNEKANPKLRNLLKVAYNHWYYTKYQKEKATTQVPQKTDYRIEGVKRNHIQSVSSNTPSSQLPN